MAETFPKSFPASMLTGMSAIDHDHQILFNRMRDDADRVAAADPVMLAQLFRSLIDDFADHFAREEKLMLDSGYGGAGAHAEQHRHLLERLEQAASSVGDDNSPPRKVVFDALDVLIRDDLYSDAEFAVWLETQDGCAIRRVR
jgi:hemerythrin-like metal-binding protein